MKFVILLQLPNRERHNAVLGFKKGKGGAEECHPSGCLFDLTMQLAIIMILKQAIGNVMELGVPFFKGYLRKKKESGFEGKPWKRDICLEQELVYKLHFFHYACHTAICLWSEQVQHRVLQFKMIQRHKKST